MLLGANSSDILRYALSRTHTIQTMNGWRFVVDLELLGAAGASFSQGFTVVNGMKYRAY